MSLWDKDKITNKRLNPSPSARDTNESRMAHGTVGFNLTQENSDPLLAKLVVKDGRLLLSVEGSNFIDLSNGNIEVKRVDANVVGRMGYRPSDSTGAIDVAKPGDNL